MGTVAARRSSTGLAWMGCGDPRLWANSDPKHAAGAFPKLVRRVEVVTSGGGLDEFGEDGQLRETAFWRVQSRRELDVDGSAALPD